MQAPTPNSTLYGDFTWPEEGDGIPWHLRWDSIMSKWLAPQVNGEVNGWGGWAGGVVAETHFERAGISFETPHQRQTFIDLFTQLLLREITPGVALFSLYVNLQKLLPLITADGKILNRFQLGFVADEVKGAIDARNLNLDLNSIAKGIERIASPVVDRNIGEQQLPEAIQMIYPDLEGLAVRAKTPSAITAVEVIATASDRDTYFKKVRGWLVGEPSKALRKKFNEIYRIPEDELVGLDLDENDIASGTLHWELSFKGLEDKVRPARARTIYLQILEEEATKSSSPITSEVLSQMLSSIPNSPYDRSGLGPTIDKDIRTQALSNPEVATMLQGTKLEPGTHPSATEQAVELIAEYLGNREGRREGEGIIDQFIDRLTSRKPILLFERLVSIREKGVDATPLLLLLMLEIAIHSFENDSTLWMLQCDDPFTRVLMTLFGEKAFVRLSRTTQLVKNTKISTAANPVYKEDACNTLLLDINIALKNLKENTVNDPFHSADYALNSLTPQTKQRVLDRITPEERNILVEIPKEVRILQEA